MPNLIPLLVQNTFNLLKVNNKLKVYVTDTAINQEGNRDQRGDALAPWTKENTRSISTIKPKHPTHENWRNRIRASLLIVNKKDN